MSETIGLPSHARRVEPALARQADSTAWARASNMETTVDVIATGRARVRVGDGDVHEVALVEDDRGMIGACDCDGFAFHDELAGGVCAHVATLARESALDPSLVEDIDGTLDVDGPEHDQAALDEDSDDDQEVDPVAAGRAAGGHAAPVDDDDRDESADERETVGHVEPDVVAHDPDDAPEQAPSTREEPAEPRGQGSESTLDNPFAGEIEDVDERFVMRLGGDPYIRREGWQRLARTEGYRIRSEMVTWQGETESTLAEARAEVLEGDEVIATGTGTAHIDAEDLSGAVGNLNELAETRAISRAMGWATGAGLAAVEVDADAEHGRDHDVATDGGRR